MSVEEIRRLPIGEDDIRLLDVSAKLLYNFFFDKNGNYKSYGDKSLCTKDNISVYWLYERALLYDLLKSQFTNGDYKSEFAGVEWNDKFLYDLQKKSEELSELIPEDFDNNDWINVVKICSSMLFSSYFVEKGLISEKGKENIITTALKNGYWTEANEDDYYDCFFRKYAFGIKE